MPKSHGLIRLTVGAALVVVAVIGVIEAESPAGASALRILDNLTHCSSSAPCVQAQNTGAGRAIVGTAQAESGVVGKTMKFSFKDPGDAAGNGGVLGIDLSTPRPGKAAMNFTAGLFGDSKSGLGLLAVSNMENGGVGVTFNQSLTSGNSENGLVGLDNSSDGGFLNNGIEGVTGAGFGVFGVTANPSTVDPVSGVGVSGFDVSADGGLLNIGVWGQSAGVGVLAVGAAPQQPLGSLQYPALQVDCLNGGPAMIASSAPNMQSSDFMSLDCSGDLTVTGNVVAGGTPLTSTRTSTGAQLVTYAPQQAEPTIEDVGEARLVGGRADVELDPAFASTMDRTKSYLVFITPEGDSRGLFLASKTTTGFSVRENGGGTNTLLFEYRIVGKPLAVRSARLPTLTSVLLSEAARAHARQNVRSIDMLAKMTHRSAVQLRSPLRLH
jgi:hypothetical protein